MESPKPQRASSSAISTMSLSIVVTVEVTAATDEKGNTITAQSGIAEGVPSDIRRLANEAASRAEAAINSDVIADV